MNLGAFAEGSRDYWCWNIVYLKHYIMGNSVNDNMLIKINISKEKHKNQMVSLIFDKGKKRKRNRKFPMKTNSLLLRLLSWMVQLEWVLKVKGSINGGGGSLAFCGSYGIIRLHPQAYKYLHYENIFYLN